MVISAPVWKDSWEYVAISVSLIHNILANGVACLRLKDEVLVFSGVFLWSCVFSDTTQLMFSGAPYSFIIVMRSFDSEFIISLLNIN